MGRRLGQHFLKNSAILDYIASSIDISGKSTIIEIGPGHGELTERIKTRLLKEDAQKKIKIIAIEKDPLLAAKLQKRFENEKHITIVCGDALSELRQFADSIFTEYIIAGNIPYYITGHILRIIGSLQKKPAHVLFVIQKEVAERIVANPPRMNLLAACIQAWASPTIKKMIPKKEFSPPPKVDSALIELSVKEAHVPDSYYQTARIIFAHPRKTLLNNLSSKISKKEAERCMTELGISSRARPQDISVAQIFQLTEKIK